MPRLILGFLLLSLGWSCKPLLPVGYTKVNEKGMFQSSYFEDKDEDYVYKASIDVLGRSFGGIWVIKKMSEGDYRVAMTTEFGNKIFDFSLSESQGFNKNFVIEPLDKKPIVNFLRKDIESLIQSKFNYLYKYQNNDNLILILRKKKYVQIEEGELITLSHWRNKHAIHFGKGSKTHPDSITIERRQLGMKIVLSKMD
jgi:hypothetical protein